MNLMQIVTNEKKKTSIHIICGEWKKSTNPKQKPEKKIKNLLLEKYGKRGIEKLEEERAKLPEKAMHMKKLYENHKDLTAFSVLDKEDFHDYE